MMDLKIPYVLGQQGKREGRFPSSRGEHGHVEQNTGRATLSFWKFPRVLAKVKPSVAAAPPTASILELHVYEQC